MKKRVISAFLSFSILLSIFTVSAFAADTTIDILALGDSITAGYGLADVDTQCFTALLDQRYGDVVNKGIDGNTAAGILSQFTDTPLLPDAPLITDSEIRDADVITITSGGNDLMAVLYSKMVGVWNNNHRDDQLQADQITTIMKDSSNSRYAELLGIGLKLLDKNNALYFIDDPEFDEELQNYVKNLIDITAHIHRLNPDATVIVETQYNPYVEFKGGSIFGFISLDPLYSGMEEGTTLLNNAIKAHAEAGDYFVADVKKAFDSYTGGGDLYNAVFSNFNITAISVDFHPTAEGHYLIAKTFQPVIDAITYHITVSESTNGIVTADKQTARIGETVTLTVTPAAHYLLDTLTAQDGLGDPVPIIETDSGTYQLTVPVGNVHVIPVFRPKVFTDLTEDGSLQLSEDGYFFVSRMPEKAATAILAAYDGSRRLTNCQVVPLQTGTETKITISGSDIRLFLLDSNYRPVQDAIPFPNH